ncbi:MAG: glycoside hydrolase family protein [Acidimicrobiales bacterium]
MIDLEFTAGFIAQFEGFVDHVYLDAVNVETIGFGETRRDLIERYRGGITRAEGLELLKGRVQEFADNVAACITNGAALTPERHAALTSLAYNIGVGAFRGSTACKRFNAGELDGVAEAINMWNKAGGQVLAGLSRRRSAEAALFQGGGSSPGAMSMAAAPATEVLREGERGDAVRELQRRLTERGFALTADGIFGPATGAAVRAFQGQNGLDADGVVGPATWARLTGARAAPPPCSDASEVPPWPGRLLAEGVDGDDVRRAQGRLKERGWRIVVDARFGPKTDAVVRKYQGEKALVVDGCIGPTTWRSMWTVPVTGRGADPDDAS